MKIKFHVTGMTCAACSARVEKVTRAVPGVEIADVNLLAGTMQVEAREDVSANLRRGGAGTAESYDRCRGHEYEQRVRGDQRVTAATV